MTERDRGDPQFPACDDVRRLLECVNALHKAGPADQVRTFAQSAMTLLDASILAVDAGRPGSAQRVATVAAASVIPSWALETKPVSGVEPAGPNGRAGARELDRAARRVQAARAEARRSGMPHAPAAHAVHHQVHTLSANASAANPVSLPALQSVYTQSNRLSAITAWRSGGFGSRHLTMLKLLHPAATWMFDTLPGRSGLPASTDAVLVLMLKGMREKEIAHRLGRSTHTVHAHVKRVYRHYDVSNRGQLIARFYETARPENG